MVTLVNQKLASARLLYGTVIALDQHGQQMPDFSGAYSRVHKAIEAEGVTITRSPQVLKGDRK
jgi:hypothetical protein